MFQANFEHILWYLLKISKFENDRRKQAISEIVPMNIKFSSTSDQSIQRSCLETLKL